MDSSPTYLDPKVLAKIEGLQLRAKQVVEGFVNGLHRSPFRGFSIEFSEHREYASGDDPRYLDWKVLGRTDRLYVKQFEDETNLIAYLAIDASESMGYQSQPDLLTKYDYGAVLSASLAWLVLSQHDAAALAVFDQQVEKLTRPSTGGAHLKEILAQLESVQLKKKTAIGNSLRALGEKMRRRGVVIVFSDLFEEPKALESGLRRLRQAKHHVQLVHLLDPGEVHFSFQRPTRFLGMEGKPNIVADPIGLRRTYLAEFEKYLRRVEQLARSLQVQYTRIVTDQPLDEALRRLVDR